MKPHGEEYRKGAKTGNRAPLQTERVRAGLAKLPALVPSSLFLGDDDIAAALRYCARLEAWNANPRRIEKRAAKNAERVEHAHASGRAVRFNKTKAAAQPAAHPDMIETNNGAKSHV